MKFTYISIATLLIAIIFSFYKYYLIADYNFIIEVSCNPITEDCKYRPCDIDPQTCLPDMLSYYKSYTIKAYDFKTCHYDCLLECNSGQIKCVPYE